MQRVETVRLSKSDIHQENVAIGMHLWLYLQALLGTGKVQSTKSGSCIVEAHAKDELIPTRELSNLSTGRRQNRTIASKPCFQSDMIMYANYMYIL